MAFDKAKFLTSAPETETVTVPGFGAVTVRGLVGEEYDRYEEASTVPGPDGDSVYRTDRALLVRLAAVDPDTLDPVFADADLPRLRALPVRVLNPIARAAGRLCGWKDDPAGN